MEAQPAIPDSFHVDIVDADLDRAIIAANTRRIDRERFLVSILSDLSIIVFMILLPIYFVFYDMPPEFSIQVVPAINNGLDAHTPAAAPGGASISPAFNLTLHARNRRATARCYHDGEAVVGYAGFTLATGRVPAFCVPGKGEREVAGFVASADGVGLPGHVLGRMALERRVGAAQLDVEVKLFRRDDRSDRPTWVWCGMRMVDGTTRPPEVAPCTVLGLQNWFSVDVYQ